MNLLADAAGDVVATLAAGGPAAWALKHWKLVVGAAGLLLLAIALAIAAGNARHWHKVADRNHDLLVESRQALSTTLESLAKAQREINDNNQRVQAAAARLEDAKRQSAADQARADERWRGTEATIADLQAAARRPDRKPCTLSNEARRALEDL